MATKPVSLEEREKIQREWLTGRPLSDLLPYKAPDGVLVTEIDPECSVCHCAMERAKVRVQITTHPNRVTEFRAIGICCNTATRFLWRFRPEGGMDSLVGFQWKHFNFSRTNPPYWNLSGWFKKLFTHPR